MENQKKILGASVATGLALLVGANYMMSPSKPQEQVIPTELPQPESSEYVPAEPIIEEEVIKATEVPAEEVQVKEKPTITERVKRFFRREPKKVVEKPRRLQGEKSSPNTSVTVSRTDKTYKLYSPPSITYQRHQSWSQMNANKNAGYGDFEGYGADFGRTKSAFRGK